jgi:tRNA A-37 threonylcarbamoyl transferase component Bud32
MFRDIKKNNIKWTVKDGLDENILENIYPRLKNFADYPEFSIVKDNNVRTVLFLKPEDNASNRIFVKLYKKGGPGVKAKHLAIPSKAYSEWKGLNYFVNKRLPCPEPLAFSEKKRFGLLDESCLLIEVIPSAFPLNEYIENNILEPDIKNGLIISIARLIKDLHSYNIFYRDLHGGNILIRKNQESLFELFFIDLHKAAFPKKISTWMRIKDIAQFLNSILFSEENRFVFLKEYLGKNDEHLKLFSQKVALKQNKLKNTRIKSRSKRCIKKSSVFESRKNSKETYYGRKDFGKKETDEVLALHTLIKKNKNGPILKSSEKSVITIVEREGKESLCVKENNFINVLYALKNMFRKSRALKSWIASNGLIVRGIDTPPPRAVVEKKFGLFVIKSYIISSFMNEAKELNDYINVFKNPAQIKNKSAFIKACAGVLKNLHSKGIYHSDLKSNNILVTESEKDIWNFYFIDLDRVLFRKDISFYQRANNLAQLNASVSRLMTTKDRLKFFYFYAKDTQLYDNRKKYYQRIIKISRTKKTEIYDISFK